MTTTLVKKTFCAAVFIEVSKAFDSADYKIVKVKNRDYLTN